MITATVTTEFKKNFKHYVDRALNGECIIITRGKQENAVLISEEEYNELQRIKNNSDYMYKMNRSIEQAKAGKIVGKTMDELKEMESE